MRCWWVNQNQTYRQERAGGYLWSPKRNANGHRNPFYEFMREVAPGDLVLSFVDTRIPAVGVVQSYCYEAPKPAEFGTAGPTWDKIGWRVDVNYQDLTNRIRPADHMASLAPVLPDRYAPLLADGRGLQSVYLTAIPDPLMAALSGLIGREVTQLMQMTAVAEPLATYEKPQIDWEEHLQAEIASNASLDETEKQQLILARRGQGEFRKNVQSIERFCRVTKVDRPEHLRASHCKPWRDCESSDEPLNGENGLLLTPSIDHLFDRGFISFEDKGDLLVSPVAHHLSLILPDNETAMVEAAHIIPFAESHDDDPRNGIALTPSFHWAMDRNLIAPGPDYKWHVSATLDKRFADNKPLLDLDGQSLILPKEKRMWPREDALDCRLKRLRGTSQRESPWI